MKLIQRDEVMDFLTSLKGKRFEVVFIKRSTGLARSMRATTDYAKYLKGGQAAYDARAKGLIPVWDLDVKAFRSIPTDAVLTIKVKSDVYTVIEKGE